MNLICCTSVFASPGRRRAFAAVAGLLAAALLLSGCDRFLSAEARIERATAEFEAGRYAEAMRDAKTALEAEPDNAGGRVLLARINLRLGDAESARKELDRAIESGADAASLRDLHYDIMLAQGRFDDVLIGVAVDDRLAAVRKLYLTGMAQVGLGRSEEAGSSIDEALQLEPGNRDVQLLEARWLWSVGRYDEATTKLAAITAADPGDAEAWLFLGRLALSGGDAQAAVAAFEEARKSADTRLTVPDQFAVSAGLIDAYLALGDSTKAEAEVKLLEGRAKDAFVTRYFRARLAFLKGDYRSASAELQRVLSQRPDSVPARLLLGASLLEQGANEQAEAELSRLVSEHPDNIEARKLLARVLTSRSDIAGAQRVLANAGPGARDAGMQWLSGTLALVSGQTAEGIATLEAASKADPDNVPLKLDLARGYLAAGRRADAVALLSALPAGEGGPRQRQLEVMAEVIGRDPAGARAGISRLVQENAADGDLLSMAASYLLAVGEAAGARDVYLKAVAASPKSAEARVGLAASLLETGDPDRAEAELRKVIELDPAAERAYIGLAGIQRVRGDRAGAQRWLEQAIGANPGAVEARIQLAGLALASQDVARMKALAEQALSVTRTRPQTLNRVGQLLMQASNYEEALQRFNEAAAAGFDDAGVNAALAMLALGRDAEARARLEALAAQRRDWAAPMVYLSAIDAGQKRTEQALARITAFERAGGRPAAAEEVRSDVLMAAGRPKDAVAALERASQLQPSSSIAIKLYRARMASAVPSPEASLQQWLQANPGDVTVRVLLAEFHQRQGDRKSAIRHYETALQTAFSPPVMNNLAWLYYETGDGRALDLARRAYDAQPDRFEIADTFGWILVEKGRVEEGLPVLEKALRAAPGQPDIQYHYAAALARSGRKQDAIRSLETLLGQAPTFASRADAEKLLKSLGGS